MRIKFLSSKTTKDFQYIHNDPHQQVNTSRADTLREEKGYNKFNILAINIWIRKSNQPYIY